MKSGGESPRFFWGGGERWGWVPIEKNKEYGIIKDMPELSRFLGIVIAMYFKDHNPPHFHVLYGE
jgi:hypothetical protein